MHYFIDPTAQPYARIADLQYAGAPVLEDDRFILATNQFRVSGGGGYVATQKAQIVTRPTASIQSSMTETLKQSGATPWDENLPWRFAPSRETQAIILTHPDALECIADIRHLRPALKGTTPDGFIRLCVTL